MSKIHNSKIIRYFLSFIAIVLILTSQVIAQDWPQWRGPNRDGIVSGFTPVKSWPESLKLQWKVSVGTGYATPLVKNNNVYTFTRNEEKNEEVLTCLSLTDGKILWQKSYSVPYTPSRAAGRHGKSPKSTPVLYQDKLVSFGISGILSCYESKNGKLLWRKEYSDVFPTTYPLYGTAISPLVHKGILIIHVGGHDNGALIAFDIETGNEKWRWAEDGPSYTSPIVVEIEGAEQIITQTQNFFLGISVNGGKSLWKIPFTTSYDQNIVTPVIHKQMVIYSGLRNGMTAVKVTKQGNVWSTRQVWHNSKESIYMSSPVIGGGRLFGFAPEQGGHFFCLNAETGETQWISEENQGTNAALLSTGDLLFTLTDKAMLSVVQENSEGFKPIQQYKVAETQTWAHPVLVGKRILVKDNTDLYLWSIE